MIDIRSDEHPNPVSFRPRRRGRPPRQKRSMSRAAGAAVCAAVVMVGACGAAPAAGAANLTWGLYSGPGKKSVAGADSFAATSKIKIGGVLDFLPDETWKAMTSASWLIDAHRDRRYSLELSIPMLPRTGDASLAACATGAYNTTWRTIAGQLAAAGRGDAILRPGWEMNGNWYRWSAVGQASNYIGCFRQLVTTMRSISKNFRFDWTVNGGDNVADGTLFYPGSAYVDDVGVDLYNYNYRGYATPAGAQTTAARTDAWNYALSGPRGLNFWAGFARKQSRPFALSEWGLAWRADGHAGGDDTIYVRGIYAFVTTPANNVAWATYFNSADSATVKHNLTAPGSVFPNSRATFFSLAKS